MSDTAIRFLPEDKLIERALEALILSLGPVEAARFLSLARGERIESVARHHQWQAGLDRGAFLDKVFGLPTTVQ
jgi:hypothetical protein